MAPTIKSSDIFEKKVLFEVNNGNRVGQFIVDYINDKSYGSFRTFSKRLQEVTKRLADEGLITQSEITLIQVAIKEKLSSKQPEIIFDFDKFLENYVSMFSFYKDEINHPLNTLFLSLPFVLTMTFNEIQEIKVNEINVVDLNNSILVRYKNESGTSFKNIKITQYYNEWMELFNLFKSDRNLEDKLFLNEIMTSHTVFSQKLEPYLSKYAKKKTTSTKFYTLLKNCLKYSSNFCSII